MTHLATATLLTAIAAAPPPSHSSERLISALAASSAASASVDTYVLRFEQVANEVGRGAASAHSPRDRAAVVQSVLHRYWLTGTFDERCDSIAATLDTGRYNCVTATILFAALAETIDLPVQCMHAPGHVYLRIAGFDIEPTSQAWFARSELNNGRAGRAIGFEELLGKLYYNRGVVALERNDYPVAIDAFETALRLDAEDAETARNLSAAFNNAALAASRQGAHSAAHELLEKARRMHPQDATLAANTQHIERQWAIALCEQGRYAEALALFARGDSDFHRAGQVVVHRLWAEDLVRRGETHAALSRIAAGLALSPQDERLRRLERALRP